MSELNLNSTVGSWVAHYPATSRVFQEFKIDFCCGGGISLQEVCDKKNIDPQVILQQLKDVQDGRQDSDEKDWTTATLTELYEHIVDTHHKFLRSELPRLEKMARRVAQVHGESHPELIEVRDVFLELQAELKPHMMKEEQVLFPAIRQLESTSSPIHFPFGSVGNPIQMMEHEHDSAGDAIRKLRELTNQFMPPPEACNTYRALFDGLQDLEADLHTHIHKENNILFPRAAQLENDLLVV